MSAIQDANKKGFSVCKYLTKNTSRTSNPYNHATGIWYFLSALKYIFYIEYRYKDTKCIEFGQAFCNKVTTLTYICTKLYCIYVQHRSE